MADWTFKYPVAGTDTDISVDFNNLVGGSLSDVSKIASGVAGEAFPLAGVYRFTLVTTDTVSCEGISSEDQSNPLVFSGTRAVVSGVNTNLLPGIEIDLAVTRSQGDIFDVGIGCVWDLGAARWVRVLSGGLVLPGFSSSEMQITVENTGTLNSAFSRLVATNAVRIENGQSFSRPFLVFRQSGPLNPTADANLSGAPITFANRVTGPPVLIDLKVSGVSISVFDVAAGTTNQYGTGLTCDGSTVYVFSDGTKYQGCEFILSPSILVTDTATIFVSGGGSMVEIATIDSDFVAGTTGIYLTGEDRYEGTMNVGDDMEFRFRYNPPAGSDITLNEYSYSLRATGYRY